MKSTSRKSPAGIKTEIDYSNVPWKKRLLVATPTEGWIRYEWAHCRYGQTIPVNWLMHGYDLDYATCGYSIDDAYNMICRRLLDEEAEWLITVEDDVLLPLDCFLKMGVYMEEAKYPVVSGLYYSKGYPPQPLVFRGIGNGAYKNWKLGELVWADGLPMGCLLIHASIIRWFWDNTEEYLTPNGEKTHRIFVTPRQIVFDPKKIAYTKMEGTQDLHFFDRVIKLGVLEKTGWKDVAKMKYPFLCDTSIFCKHIDRQTGRQYP